MIKPFLPRIQFGIFQEIQDIWYISFILAVGTVVVIIFDKFRENLFSPKSLP